MQLMLQAQSELSVDSTGSDSRQALSSEEGGTTRVIQDDSNTYQSVSSLGDGKIVEPAPEVFRATA